MQFKSLIFWNILVLARQKPYRKVSLDMLGHANSVLTSMEWITTDGEAWEVKKSAIIGKSHPKPLNSHKSYFFFPIFAVWSFIKCISEYLLDRVRLRKSVNKGGVMEDQFVYFNDNSPLSYRFSIVTKFEGRNARNTINQILNLVYLLPGDFPIPKTNRHCVFNRSNIWKKMRTNNVLRTWKNPWYMLKRGLKPRQYRTICCNLLRTNLEILNIFEVNQFHTNSCSLKFIIPI